MASSPPPTTPLASSLEPKRIRRRAHAITASILGGTAVFIWLVWSRPMVLFYLVLAVVALMTYAAIYLMVAARIEDEDAPLPLLPEGPHEEIRLEAPASADPPEPADPEPAADPTARPGG